MNSNLTPAYSILNGFLVPEHFHARRSVRRRSYMYRLALTSDEANVSRCMNYNYQALLPLVEQQRCHIVGSVRG